MESFLHLQLHGFSSSKWNTIFYYAFVYNKIHYVILYVVRKTSVKTLYVNTVSTYISLMLRKDFHLAIVIPNHD